MFTTDVQTDAFQRTVKIKIFSFAFLKYQNLIQISPILWDSSNPHSPSHNPTQQKRKKQPTMSITLPNFRHVPLSPSSSSNHHSHPHTNANANANANANDDGIQLPGLSELPSLIRKAIQKNADKYKGKQPHEIMSASQWAAANKHNEGKRKKKPPKGLVTTDGIHFFSSIRVLNFYERTKSNFVKQQSEVLNRAHTFNERDMNTFQQMWEEKALLDGNIDDLREELIMKSRKLDCACNLDRHVIHLRATRNRAVLAKKLMQKDQTTVCAYEKKVDQYEAEKEKWRALKATLTGSSSASTSTLATLDVRPPTPMLPPSGLLDLPRAETMISLKYRSDPVPPLCSFISTDVLLRDAQVIQYLVRIFQEGIDAVNAIAEDRKEKARLAEEERKKKKEERIALAKAAEAAAMLSDSEDEEDDAEDEEEETLDTAAATDPTLTEQDLIAQHQESSEEEDDTYAFSEHSSDFEDEFEDVAPNQLSTISLHGPSGDANEHQYVEQLMHTAIVEIQNTIVPPTFMKFISEALELLSSSVRERGARFVDLTGSTGAFSVLTSLWSLGWSSTVTYEKDYEDLVLAKLYVREVENIIRGEKRNTADLELDSESNSDFDSDSDDDDDDHTNAGFKKPSAGRPSTPANIVDPKTLPAQYQKRAVLHRLDAQVFAVRRNFLFQDTDPYPCGSWTKADVLFIDENKMSQLENKSPAPAHILHQIVNSLPWQDRDFGESVMNLAYSFLGLDLMIDADTEELKSSSQLEVLLEELDKQDDERIGQCMKASDPGTYVSPPLPPLFFFNLDMTNAFLNFNFMHSPFFSTEIHVYTPAIIVGVLPSVALFESKKGVGETIEKTKTQLFSHFGAAGKIFDAQIQ